MADGLNQTDRRQEASAGATELDRVGDLLVQVWQGIEGRVTWETGLGASRRHLLGALMRGPLRGRDVARVMGRKASTASGTLKRLSDEGLVELQRDKGDRRVVWFRLTDRGREVAQRVLEVKRQVLKQAVGALDQGQVQELVRLLGVVETTISEPGGSRGKVPLQPVNGEEPAP